MTTPAGDVGVAGLVLAAGGGRRFGRPKALVRYEGERLVDRAVRTVRDGGCRPVLVVSGAALFEVADAVVVDNPHWAGGMSSSLRVGLAALPADVSAAVIVLVDTPWLAAEAVRRVAAACIAAVALPAALGVAVYDGKRGHPVLIGREHWKGVIDLARGDVGARAYVARHPDAVIDVDCTGLGSPADVDTPDQLNHG